MCNFGTILEELDWQKNKVLLIEYKNDECLNEISSQDRCECQSYERMDMWNRHHANVVNQMPTRIEEDDNVHNIQNIQ